MSNLENKFTISEVNIICIFIGDSKAETITNIMSAIPDFREREMVKIAESAITKLDTITETEFADYNFNENFTDE